MKVIGTWVYNSKQTARGNVKLNGASSLSALENHI